MRLHARSFEKGQGNLMTGLGSSWSLDRSPQHGAHHHPSPAQVKPRRSAAGWAAALGAMAAGRGEVRLFRQSWQSSQACIQQGLRYLNPAPHTSSVQTLAAAGWPFHGMSSVWRFGRHPLSSTSDSNDGRPAASASVDSSVEVPLTKTLPVVTPLPEESGPELRVETGGACIPNPQKANKLGEDAFFITKDGKSFGVADGVGGWALSGVDSGEYSRLLMDLAQFFAESKKLDVHPKQVLWAAYQQTTCRGSSTACLLKLKNDILHACNVGDSGFVVVRENDVIFQSPHQQHSFNFPYQLGKQEVDAANETPARAQVFAIQLQPEDIVIAGTDGLFDNVFPEESAALIRHARARGESANAAAKTLADYTFKKAADERHMSPFAYSAQAHGHRFVGGKMDDITVVVSFISAADEPEPSANGSSSSSSSVDGEVPVPPLAPKPTSKL